MKDFVNIKDLARDVQGQEEEKQTKSETSQNHTETAQNDQRAKMNQRTQRRSNRTSKSLKQSFVTFFPDAPHQKRGTVLQEFLEVKSSPKAFQ